MTDQLRAAARSHPFLAAVRDGTLAPEAFARWLVADARWVEDLLVFQARLLARAPRPARAVLADGLVGLVDELEWFDAHLRDRGLGTAGAAAADGAAAYSAYLRELDALDADRALTALWMIEQAYLDAWTDATPPEPGPYSAFADHWTTPAFHDYVHRLRVHADPDGHADVVADVLRHEIAFWDITLG